ncbi:MAG TPA: response regulator, partial [Actinomycetota bacterium]|nr:response regulator [Actinomycetota bacterium]
MDGQRLFAEAISQALTRLGADPICVRTTPEEATATAADHQPDLILVEIAIGGVDGIRLGGELGEVSPSSKVVALTSVARPVVVRRAMAAGFHGFLTKDTSAEGFQRSVRAILDGRLVFPGRPRKVVAHPGGASANGHGDGHGNGSG